MEKMKSPLAKDYPFDTLVNLVHSVLDDQGRDKALAVCATVSRRIAQEPAVPTVGNVVSFPGGAL
ncbi:MAG: hypothetical protein RIC93_01560 [Alphaproteobacteria bacterium]